MSISVSAIKTAYNTLHTTYAATVAAAAVITGLGEIPQYPIDVTADADYNNVTTARNTWLSSMTTAQTNSNTAVAAQKVAEAGVVALPPPNPWVPLSSLT